MTSKDKIGLMIAISLFILMMASVIWIINDTKNNVALEPETYEQWSSSHSVNGVITVPNPDRK